MDASQLAQLEGLCHTFYESGSQAEKKSAQQSLLVLQSSAEYIPQCQYVLDNSTNSYALLVASNSLTKLISTHWNNFTSSQRVDIRKLYQSLILSKGCLCRKLRPFLPCPKRSDYGKVCH